MIFTIKILINTAFIVSSLQVVNQALVNSAQPREQFFGIQVTSVGQVIDFCWQYTAATPQLNPRINQDLVQPPTLKKKVGIRTVKLPESISDRHHDSLQLERTPSNHIQRSRSPAETRS